MRRFSPVSSSYILILSLSPEFVVQQKPINVWCISIVLPRYSNLLAVKLHAPSGFSFITSLSQTHTIITLINFKIKEMTQNYCILCLLLFCYSCFILCSLYFLLLVRKGMVRGRRCREWVGSRNGAPVDIVT